MKKAFTLTEVIIVLVILGALALILIPNMIKMVPDDHNIKYKKAFFTIQEIVSDIADDPSVCTGLNAAGDNVINDNIFLNSCRGHNLRTEISKKLSTVVANDLSDDIRTTNNMRWFIPNQDFGTAFVNIGDTATIVVSLDDNAPSSAGVALPTNENNGIFQIIINADGKVTPPTPLPGNVGVEQNLLLNAVNE